MTFDRGAFEQTRLASAVTMAEDTALQTLAGELFVGADRHNYVYQWTWLGVPIIQVPTDIMAVQEIIWSTKPDIIIETGVAWGGSILLLASICELIGKGQVIGIDTVLPESNRRLIQSYRFGQRVRLINGSSTDREIIGQVEQIVGAKDQVMVILDSNHTHDHVLSELRAYGPMVTPGQYLVCTDTIVESAQPQPHRSRPWGPGNNPKTALTAYLAETDRFEVDPYVNAKLLVTFSPGGYLRCIGEDA